MPYSGSAGPNRPLHPIETRSPGARTASTIAACTVKPTSKASSAPAIASALPRSPARQATTPQAPRNGSASSRSAIAQVAMSKPASQPGPADSASASDSIIPASSSWLKAMSGIKPTMPNAAARAAAANAVERPLLRNAPYQARILAAHNRTAMIRQPSAPHRAVVHARTGVRIVTNGAVGMPKTRCSVAAAV